MGIQLFGRLKPGVTASQADAEAKILEKRYVDAGPPQLKQFVERSGMTMNVGGVQEQRVQPVRPTLLMLQGGVAFVLLIGCVNVANLLLVRSNARQSELAVRIRARGRARDDCPAVPAGKPAVDVPRRGAGAGRGLGGAAGDEFLPGEDAAPVAAGVARLARARIRRRRSPSWSACSSA